MTARQRHSPASDMDVVIGRLLTIGTYVSVLLLAIGCVLLFANQILPLAGGPPLEPGLIVDDISHLRPAGFMWLGLLVLIATPTARVVVSFFGYVRRGERTMAVVSVLILVVLAASVLLGSVEA
jgi:uncharacterized membrane protein